MSEHIIAPSSPYRERDEHHIPAGDDCYWAAQHHLLMRLGYTVRWVRPADLAGPCDERSAA